MSEERNFGKYRKREKKGGKESGVTRVSLLTLPAMK